MFHTRADNSRTANGSNQGALTVCVLRWHHVWWQFKNNVENTPRHHDKAKQSVTISITIQSTVPIFKFICQMNFFLSTVWELTFETQTYTFECFTFSQIQFISNYIFQQHLNAIRGNSSHCCKFSEELSDYNIQAACYGPGHQQMHRLTCLIKVSQWTSQFDLETKRYWLNTQT